MLSKKLMSWASILDDSTRQQAERTAALPFIFPHMAPYIRDLRWAQPFGLLNREEMMHRVIDCLQDWIGRSVEATETVNTHHNYTAKETHSGKEVWLSRKGAIDASAGWAGLIPGSTGTRSYVVVGKGNRLGLKPNQS